MRSLEIKSTGTLDTTWGDGDGDKLHSVDNGVHLWDAEIQYGSG